MNFTPNLPSIEIPRNYNLADWTSFGQSMIMQVDDIGYQNPDMLFFYGYINGNKTQLIQHSSQLNFMLMTVKKEEPDRPPRRIGFITDDEE